MVKCRERQITKQIHVHENSEYVSSKLYDIEIQNLKAIGHMKVQEKHSHFSACGCIDSPFCTFWLKF